MSGGDDIYAIILWIVSLFLSYLFFSRWFISKKAREVLGTSRYISYGRKNILFSNLHIGAYWKKIYQKLHCLGNPWGLTANKYIYLKYVMPSFILFILVFRHQNFLTALNMSMIFFGVPDVLLMVYQKRENVQMINELSNVVQNIILSLSANLSLVQAMQVSKMSIQYTRFYTEFDTFIHHYEMYGYQMAKAVEDFESKFHSYEFNMFLSILVQGEKEGNIQELLEAFYQSLQLLYFKYRRLISSQRVLLVSLSAAIVLVHSTVLVMYPIVVQVSQQLTEILN